MIDASLPIELLPKHQDLVAQRDWRKIKQLAQEAMAMGELMVENNEKTHKLYIN